MVRSPSSRIVVHEMQATCWITLPSAPPTRHCETPPGLAGLFGEETCAMLEMIREVREAGKNIWVPGIGTVGRASSRAEKDAPEVNPLW